MAETIAANKLMENIITHGEKDIINQYLEILRINGTDITGGDVVTREGETSPDIDLRGSGEAVEGIVLEYASEADKKASYSLGVTIADNALAKVLRRTGGRVRVQVVCDRSATTTPGSAEIEVGTPIFASDTDAGKVTIAAPSDNAAAQEAFIGYAAKNYAAASADIVIEVNY